MKKNIKKLEVIDMENETRNEVLEENETVEAGKPKWSLKKKLLIGGGVLAGLVLGAVALGNKKGADATDDQTEDSEDDNTDATDDVEDTTVILENVEE